MAAFSLSLGRSSREIPLAQNKEKETNGAQTLYYTPHKQNATNHTSAFSRWSAKNTRCNYRARLERTATTTPDAATMNTRGQQEREVEREKDRKKETDSLHRANDSQSRLQATTTQTPPEKRADQSEYLLRR